MSSTHVGRRVGLDAGSLRLGLAVVALEALLVAAYFDLTTATVTEPRYLVYPFVWINAGVWAVLRTTPRPGNRLHRLLGLSVAVGYFLVLLAVLLVAVVSPRVELVEVESERDEQEDEDG